MCSIVVQDAPAPGQGAEAPADSSDQRADFRTSAAVSKAPPVPWQKTAALHTKSPGAGSRSKSKAAPKTKTAAASGEHFGSDSMLKDALAIQDPDSQLYISQLVWIRRGRDGKQSTLRRRIRPPAGSPTVQSCSATGSQSLGSRQILFSDQPRGVMQLGPGDRLIVELLSGRLPSESECRSILVFACGGAATGVPLDGLLGVRLLGRSTGEPDLHNLRGGLDDEWVGQFLTTYPVRHAYL